MLPYTCLRILGVSAYAAITVTAPRGEYVAGPTGQVNNEPDVCLPSLCRAFSEEEVAAIELPHAYE